MEKLLHNYTCEIHSWIGKQIKSQASPGRVVRPERAPGETKIQRDQELATRKRKD